MASNFHRCNGWLGLLPCSCSFHLPCLPDPVHACWDEQVPNGLRVRSHQLPTKMYLSTITITKISPKGFNFFYSSEITTTKMTWQSLTSNTEDVMNVSNIGTYSRYGKNDYVLGDLYFITYPSHFDYKTPSKHLIPGIHKR